MGTVYVADRDDAQFRKRVAIKVLKPGSQSPDSMRRFQLERQVLAALDHPSIVHLLDAGMTHGGIPFVVMDCVEGIPIDRYCEARNLSILDRLRLFLRVCSAVQYAHQNLVIHCDIKPANILVTPDGMPKLLDFGIGKLLNPAPMPVPEGTTATLRPVTPDHASPEQMLGDPITTATDIYALGLTLYEVLAGRPPFQANSELELAYKITKTGPEIPSKLTGDARLRGDLDAIILKAMHRDPASRYQTVAEFEADIKRYLDGLPIAILSGNPRYRLAKFIERNRLAVMAGTLGGVLLVSAVCVTGWQAVVARQERARAEARFNDVRHLVNMLLFDFYNAASKIPGATSLQELMVRRSVAYLDTLSKDAADDVQLGLDVMDAYTKFGDIQGNPYQANLGDTAGAMASYQKALGISERLLASHAHDGRVQRASAKTHQEIADVLAVNGDAKGALAHVDKAAKIFELLAKQDPRSVQARIDLASCLEGYGDLIGHPGLMSMGKQQPALEKYRSSLSNWEAVSSLDMANQRAKRAVPVLEMKIADMEADRGDADSALDRYRKALNAAQALGGDTAVRRLSAILNRKVGVMLGEKGDSAGAEQYLRAAIGQFESFASADPVNTRARVDLANAWTSLGEHHRNTGNVQQALAGFGKAADLLEALSRSEPANARYRAQLGDVLLRIGALLENAGQRAEAQHQTRRGLEIVRLLANEPDAAASELDRAANALLTCTPEQLRNPKEAMAFAERAVQLTNFSEPGYLNTLSDAQLAAGANRASALQTVRKALALDPPPPLKKVLESKLADLQKMT